MADTLYTTQIPATDEFDLITHFLGLEFGVSANRECVAGRAWIPAAGRPPVFFWQLWRVTDQVMLAEVDLNNPGFGSPPGGNWMTFTSANFITPGNIAIVAGLSYVEGVFSDDGHFLFTNPGLFPIGTGVLSATVGRHKTGGLRTDFPNLTHTVYGFGDITVDVPGASAVPGVHSASGTGSGLTAAGSATVLTPDATAVALTAAGTP